MTISSPHLRAALSSFATGVAVVAGTDESGRLVGATINSFSSVSLDPPLVLFSYQKTSSRLSRLAGLRSYSIHVLSDDQRDVAAAFAAGKEDRWREFLCCEPETRTWNLDRSLASFRCIPYATYQGGDHLIFLGMVIGFQCGGEGHPMVFYRSRYEQIAAAVLSQ